MQDDACKKDDGVETALTDAALLVLVEEDDGCFTLRRVAEAIITQDQTRQVRMKNPDDDMRDREISTEDRPGDWKSKTYFYVIVLLNYEILALTLSVRSCRVKCKVSFVQSDLYP